MLISITEVKMRSESTRCLLSSMKYYVAYSSGPQPLGPFGIGRQRTNKNIQNYVFNSFLGILF